MLMTARPIAQLRVPSHDIDDEIKLGADWLVSRFEVDGGGEGWREAKGDAISEGLTFQVFVTLLRYATSFDTSPAVRSLLRTYVPRALVATLGWAVGHADSISYLDAHSQLPGTSRREFFRMTSFLWYPWAIECATAWLYFARKYGGDTECAHRALSHLVVTLQPDMRRLLAESPTYRVAEALYALGAVENI